MTTENQLDAIVIDDNDNVATALRKLKIGEQARIGTPSGTRNCTIREAIPLCHKLALIELAAGDEIVKYGAAIGCLKTGIEAGGHVHVHNMQSQRAQR